MQNLPSIFLLLLHFRLLLLQRCVSTVAASLPPSTLIQICKLTLQNNHLPKGIVCEMRFVILYHQLSMVSPSATLFASPVWMARSKLSGVERPPLIVMCVVPTQLSGPKGGAVSSQTKSLGILWKGWNWVHLCVTWKSVP